MMMALAKNCGENKTMVNQRITELLSMAKDPGRVFPATDLYNEG